MRHFSASLQAFAAGALFLTTGCAPSVYTSIQKSYPARIEGSTVLVYDMADSLPEPAEVLGSVTVKDSGFSVNCNYAKVMQRAKDETNKIGGNGLHLFWHKEPSVLGSSCHRIAAHMLLLPDSVYTASYFDNVAAQNARLAAYGLIPADGTVAPGRETPKAANNNTLTFNAGYAFITSDFYLPAGVSGNPKQGLDINAAYQWTSRIGIGFGLRFHIGHERRGEIKGPPALLRPGIRTAAGGRPQPQMGLPRVGRLGIRALYGANGKSVRRYRRTGLPCRGRL